MSTNTKGMSLVEVLVGIIVVSMMLLGVVRLMTSTQKSVTESYQSLRAQAAAEGVMQKIRKMRWDANATPGIRMPLSTAPLPSVACAGSCPDEASRTAIEHWSAHDDWDGPEYPRSRCHVKVAFVTLNGSDELIPSGTPTDRKKVTVVANYFQSPGLIPTSTGTVTAVFYNLP